MWLLCSEWKTQILCKTYVKRAFLQNALSHQLSHLVRSFSFHQKSDILQEYFLRKRNYINMIFKFSVSSIHQAEISQPLPKLLTLQLKHQHCFTTSKNCRVTQRSMDISFLPHSCNIPSILHSVEPRRGTDHSICSFFSMEQYTGKVSHNDRSIKLLWFSQNKPAFSRNRGNLKQGAPLTPARIQLSFPRAEGTEKSPSSDNQQPSSGFHLNLLMACLLGPGPTLPLC